MKFTINFNGSLGHLIINLLAGENSLKFHKCLRILSSSNDLSFIRERLVPKNYLKSCLETRALIPGIYILGKDDFI